LKKSPSVNSSSSSFNDDIPVSPSATTLVHSSSGSSSSNNNKKKSMLQSVSKSNSFEVSPEERDKDRARSYTVASPTSPLDFTSLGGSKNAFDPSHSRSPSADHSQQNLEVPDSPTTTRRRSPSMWSLFSSSSDKISTDKSEKKSSHDKAEKKAKKEKKTKKEKSSSSSKKKSSESSFSEISADDELSSTSAPTSQPTSASNTLVLSSSPIKQQQPLRSSSFDLLRFAAASLTKPIIETDSENEKSTTSTTTNLTAEEGTRSLDNSPSTGRRRSATIAAWDSFFSPANSGSAEKPPTATDDSSLGSKSSKGSLSPSLGRKKGRIFRMASSDLLIKPEDQQKAKGTAPTIEEFDFSTSSSSPGGTSPSTLRRRRNTIVFEKDFSSLQASIAAAGKEESKTSSKLEPSSLPTSPEARANDDPNNKDKKGISKIQKFLLKKKEENTKEKLTKFLQQRPEKAELEKQGVHVSMDQVQEKNERLSESKRQLSRLLTLRPRPEQIAGIMNNKPSKKNVSEEVIYYNLKY
jgi:hypothetical protein